MNYDDIHDDKIDDAKTAVTTFYNCFFDAAACVRRQKMFSAVIAGCRQNTSVCLR